MKFKKKHTSNEESFWLSATDMMAGILTVVLLLLVLFVLYLNQSEDEVFTPLDASQYIGNETTTDDYGGDGGRYPTDYSTDAATYATIPNQSAGASENPTQAPTEAPTQPPSQETQEEGKDKAAVFVTVVDADTGNTIKKSGVEFELYAEKNGIGGLQTLHTYYPNKIEFKKYETNDQGTFYLPEKITDGWYSLHNTAAPNGYYIESYTDFQIDNFYDWHEPYMVTVKLRPVKSAVRISVKDPDSEQPVEKAKYEVVAAEDIRSADGTVRCKEGKVVAVLETDEEGYAESKELFLGEYQVRQISAPECYAVSKDPVMTTVGEASGSEAGDLVRIDCCKTKVSVTITDERTGEPIRNVSCSMNGRKEKLKTNAQGCIVISELKKNKTYTLKLESLPDGYRTDSEELTFIVDEDGLVNGEPSAVIEKTAYTLTLSVSAKEKVFSRPIAAVDMELVDQNGEVVDSWTSNREPYLITGLDAGTYYLQKLGDESARVTVEIKDTAKLQKADLYLWDVFDLFVLLIAGGAVLLAVLIAALLISRKKKVSINHE